jgi:hypothetical protein
MSKSNLSSRSIAITTADQVVSSASNFLFLILLAITLPEGDFARASTIWLVISFSVVVQRSVFGVPLILDSNLERKKDFRLSGSRLGSLAIGVPALVVALTFYIESGQALFLYLGLLVPLILAQDLGRYVAISESQSVKALVADLFLLIPVICGILFSWFSGEAIVPSSVSLLFAFGLVGASIIVSGKNLFRFSLVELNDILRIDKGRRIQLFFDAALVSGTAIGSVALVWIFYGSQGVAAFNGSLTALAPIGLATLVVQLVVQHGIVGSYGKVRKRESMIVFALISSGALWVLLLELMPTSTGLLFLGNSWVASKELFQAMGFSLIVGLIIEFLIVVLRAQSAFKQVIRIRRLIIFSIPVVYFCAYLLERDLQLALFLSGCWGLILIIWILLTSNPFSFESAKTYKPQQ